MYFLCLLYVSQIEFEQYHVSVIEKSKNQNFNLLSRREHILKINRKNSLRFDDFIIKDAIIIECSRKEKLYIQVDSNNEYRAIVVLPKNYQLLFKQKPYLKYYYQNSLLDTWTQDMFFRLSKKIDHYVQKEIYQKLKNFKI